MEAHQPCTRILRAEAVFHQPIPDFARRAELGDLFEKVIMGIEEEAQTRTKFIDVQSPTLRPLHIFDPVVNGESQFLQRGRAGLANVISTDRDRVEFWSEVG